MWESVCVRNWTASVIAECNKTDLKSTFASQTQHSRPLHSRQATMVTTSLFEGPHRKPRTALPRGVEEAEESTNAN